MDNFNIPDSISQKDLSNLLDIKQQEARLKNLVENVYSPENETMENIYKMLDALNQQEEKIPAGVIAIFCAYKGLGVYSLAIQALIASLVKCLAFWYVAKWAPHRVFSKDSFRYLMGFGSKLVCANVIGVAFDKIYLRISP